MSFGLKNAEAIYQRMMTRKRIGHTVEVYIDDMVVKSKEEQGHVVGLMDIFEALRWHELHFNADKCVFGVGASRFLGYMITHRGIEVNFDQINAIERLKSPNSLKEVQVLTTMLAALN